jgi:uncharacterized protein
LRPGAAAASVKIPIFFGICGKDSICSPQATLEFAKTAEKAIPKWYDEMGHFDIYHGDAFEKAMLDYLEFLNTNLAA